MNTDVPALALALRPGALSAQFAVETRRHGHGSPVVFVRGVPTELERQEFLARALEWLPADAPTKHHAALAESARDLHAYRMLLAELKFRLHADGRRLGGPELDALQDARRAARRAGRVTKPNSAAVADYKANRRDRMLDSADWFLDDDQLSDYGFGFGTFSAASLWAEASDAILGLVEDYRDDPAKSIREAEEYGYPLRPAVPGRTTFYRRADEVLGARKMHNGVAVYSRPAWSN